MRSITAFPVQVRVTYLLLLAAGLWAPLQWIHLVQLVGTSVRVLVGYCLLARSLSLAPWNRMEPFSAALVRHTFCSVRSAVAPWGHALRRPLFEGQEGRELSIIWSYDGHPRAKTSNPLAGMVTVAETGNPCRGEPPA